MERLSFAGRVLALGLCLSFSLILTWSYKAFSQEEGSSKSSEAVEEAEAREIDTQKDRIIYLAPAKKVIYLESGNPSEKGVIDIDGFATLLYNGVSVRGYKVLRPMSFYRALKEKGIPYEVFKEDPFVAPELLEEAGVTGVVEPWFMYEDQDPGTPRFQVQMVYKTVEDSKVKFKVELTDLVYYEQPMTKILKRAVEEFDRSWKSYKNFEEVMRLNNQWSKKFLEINKINK